MVLLLYLGSKQRLLSYDSASTCEKDTGYFLDITYLLTKPEAGLPSLYVRMHTDVLCNTDLPGDY